MADASAEPTAMDTEAAPTAASAAKAAPQPDAGCNENTSADAARAGDSAASSSSSSLPGEAVAADEPTSKPKKKKVDSDGDTTEDSDDELDVMEKMARAESCKDAGNVLYKGKDNPGALDKYEEGIEWLANVSRFALNKLPKASAKLVTGVRLALRLNAAQAALNLSRWADAEGHAGAAVSHAVGEPDLEAKYLKALYRRGIARSRRGDLSGAKADLLKVAKADPSNRAARRELKDAKERLKKAKAARKKQFSGMFSGKDGGGGLYDDKEEEIRQRQLADERKKHEEKKRWEAENKRREERAEPDISFADWQKQQKEKRKKEKEARDAEDKKRRKLEAEERARRRRERAASKPAGGDTADITEEDKKIMAEVKKMGYCQHKRTKEERAAFLEAVGDIAPKKIASPAPGSAAAGGDAGGADSGGAGPGSTGKRQGRSSAWNQAGTWEETDTTQWCKDRLGARVKGVRVEAGGGDALLKDDPAALIKELSEGLGAAAAGSAATAADSDKLASIMGKLAKVTARTTDVKELKGDASVAVIRGKARHLFDFTFDLKFSVEVDTSGGLTLKGDDKVAKPKKYSGTLKYTDCSATCNGDFESTVAWGKKRPGAEHAARVKECVELLRGAVNKKINQFVTEYGNER